MRNRKFLLGAIGAILAFAAAMLFLPSAASAASDTPGSVFTPANPVTRVLDTRNAIGVATHTPLGANQSLVLPLAGQDGVPADAASVVLNVTVTGQTGDSFLSVVPNGQAVPGPSQVSFHPGLGNLTTEVTVGLGNNGAVRIYNHVGTVHVLADIAGWYSPGAGGAQGEPGTPGKDAAILDANHTVDSADLAHIGGPFADNHTVLTNDQGNGNIAVPGTGKELVTLSITFCRDGAQAGSPDAVPNVVVKDTSAGTTLASLYGPPLLGSNSQVDCGIESTVNGVFVANGGSVLELDGFAYDANQGSTGKIKADYGTVTEVSLGAAATN